MSMLSIVFGLIAAVLVLGAVSKAYSLNSEIDQFVDDLAKED